MSNTAKTKICLLGVAILVIAAATVFAQSNSPVPEQPAPVQLDGRTIFYVRTTAKSITPEVRAKNIGERIQRLAADPYSRPDSIKVSDSDISTDTVSYTHLRAHETPEHLVCRLLLEKKKKKTKQDLFV